MRNYYNLGLGATVSFLMVIGFYSVMFAYRRLKRPGMSIEMRGLFLKKHAIYIVALVFFQLITLLFNYFELFNLFDKYNHEGVNQAMALII